MIKMTEITANEFTIKFNERYRLGKRAFFLFLAQRIKLSIFILAAVFLFWYFEDAIPPAYAIFNTYILEFGLLLFASVLLLIVVRTYFEYKGYSYKFEKEYFAITKGYMIKNELAIAYHQIQHVNVRRNLLDQMLGICHLTLVTAGSNNMQDSIVLPAVGKTRARIVQQELMRQARHHFYRPREGENRLTLEA